MGLDGRVRCRCWEEGLVVPPAYAGHVRVNDDGYLELDFPDDDPRQQTFWSWSDQVCPHDGMAYVSTRVANSAGISSICGGLERAGVGRFPQIARVFTERISASVDDARAMLGEIAAFRNMGELGSRMVLYNETSGEPLWHS